MKLSTSRWLRGFATSWTAHAGTYLAVIGYLQTQNGLIEKYIGKDAMGGGDDVLRFTCCGTSRKDNRKPRIQRNEMTWSDTLSLPLWLSLLLVVFTVLGIIEVTKKLAQVANWSVQSLLNVRSRKSGILPCRTLKFPQDMKQDAMPESLPQRLLRKR